MRIYLLGLLSFVLSACASSPRIPTNYSGADRGGVAIGMGAPPGYHYTSYTFKFRRTDLAGEASSLTGSLIHRTKVFLEGDAPDYRIKSADGINDESGVVVTASLAPGRYEIFGFYLDFSNGAFSQAFSSAQPFSIPFEVRSGEVAYLGNYFALPRYGVRYLGVRPRAGALFSIEDRNESDLSIARKKSGFSDVSSNFTPAVARLSQPVFITRQQRDQILKRESEGE